ncbi:MAG: phospholipid transport system transporter-binding protein [Enterobacterales bacterium]|jgi:phospholipid transport system transporter-binding protein
MSKVELLKQADGQFALTGILSKKTASSLWTKRSQFTPLDHNITIDLVGITKSDSAGLALLICLKKEALKAKAEMFFTNIPEQLQQLITLSHLEDILTTRQRL